MIKRAYKFIVSSALIAIAYSPIAFAQDSYADAEPFTLQNFVNIVEEIRNFMMGVGIVLIVVIFIWSGITFLTSNGDPEKVSQAKQRLTWAIVGAAIVLGTFIILSTVRAVLDQRSVFTSL